MKLNIASELAVVGGGLEDVRSDQNIRDRPRNRGTKDY